MLRFLKTPLALAQAELCVCVPHSFLLYNFISIPYQVLRSTLILGRPNYFGIAASELSWS